MDPLNITLEYNFEITPKDPWSDIITADLAELGFESFEETAKGFKAYLPKDKLSQEITTAIKAFNYPCQLSFKTAEIKAENWNAKWESSFAPVVVDDKCIVKADFHKVKKSYPYEITINPKMSFGTGHHQTTHLMIRFILKIDCGQKKVLDMGSGTGLLAILASMKGADSVSAIDTDEWAYQNCLENITINSIENVIVEKGDAALLAGRSFNVILANINKNVLLQDMKVYTNALTTNGTIVISGFYEQDIEDLKSVALPLGLVEKDRDVYQNWAALKFIKQN